MCSTVKWCIVSLAKNERSGHQYASKMIEAECIGRGARSGSIRGEKRAATP